MSFSSYQLRGIYKRPALVAVIDSCTATSPAGRSDTADDDDQTAAQQRVVVESRSTGLNDGKTRPARNWTRACSSSYSQL